MSANPKKPSPILSDTQAEMRNVLILLAREIATELDQLETILARKGITNSQYEKISKNPFYKRTLAAAVEEWNSPQNAENRARQQSAWGHEQALAGYIVRATDPREPLQHVNTAMANLAKWGGIGERLPDAKASDKFIISINIGNGKDIVHEAIIEHKGTPNDEPVTIEGSLASDG